LTEVPDHLLERSRARRAALGLGGDDAPAAAPAADVSAATPATTDAAAPVAAAAAAPAAPVVKEVPPPPAFVQHAIDRKKIPWWAAAALGFVPLWAIVYAGTLSEADTGAPTVLEHGGEVYAEACAGCHGPTGGGGVGPALAGGAVLETFPERADQLFWVWGGSDGWPAPSYGATGKPVSGGMPAFGESLTPYDLLAVVRYEREILSGEELDEETETLGPEEELLITTPEGEVDATVHYFGEAAEGEAGEYTITGESPFINGAEFSAPAE
jgi:mono/diheme cytochrome c family protein